MFENDLKNESIISNWICDNYFKTQQFSGEFEYVNDLNRQRKGIDLIVKSEAIFNDSKLHIIDEKAASNYIKISKHQKNMPTFSFELDYMGKNGERNDGWLFGKQFKETEYYLISWLWADNLNFKKTRNTLPTNDLTYESLSKAKCLLIKKSAIHDYLRKFKVTESNFRAISERIRDKQIVKSGKKSLCENQKYPRIYYSEKLKEKPVNVIIHEKELEKLATIQFIVESIE